MQSFIQTTTARIKSAAATKTPLAIHGGNTKAFYGGAIEGDALDMRAYTGIIEYEPRELVLTVRAGTTLAEIENVLANERQMLAFEPPQFAAGATIGGAVASGLSGPRRAYAGAVRDFVLGTRILNGLGEDLHFGGRVIKNVAGYDVSRLQAGAMGTLGVLLDLSFKVLPIPASEITLRFLCDEATAIQKMNTWAGQPLPLSATRWHAGVLDVRLSGTVAGVKAAREKLGGDIVNSPEPKAGRGLWADCRDHQEAFFDGAAPLWRISIPATTAPILQDHAQLIEWGGALRWLRGEFDAKVLRSEVAARGGHATLFRGGDKSAGVFHPVAPVLTKIHRDLKAAFDPAQILNIGRMDNT